MSELLEQAAVLGERALEMHNTISETDTVSALSALGLELAALRLTVQACALQQVEPRGAELPDVTEGWYVVELMGHRRRHGYVRAVRLAGRQLVEVTVPTNEVGLDGEPTGVVGEFVETYAAAAVFCLTPSSEDDAREDAADTSRIPF